MKSTGLQLTDGIAGSDGIDLKIDIKYGIDGLITQGLSIGDTMGQNQALMLVANPGEFKFLPTLGVAIDELLFDNDFLRFRHRIREHFALDGLIVSSVELAEGVPLKIEANYE